MSDHGHVLPEMMLTRRQVGQVLKLGITTVDKILKSGELPSVMLGGSRRVRMTDLIDFINNLQPDLTDKPTTHRLAMVHGQVLVVEQVTGSASSVLAGAAA